MFVDSHCHLDFPELSAQLDTLLANMAANQVTHAMCISVNRTDWPRVVALAEQHVNLYATVGVHPDHDGGTEAEVDEAYLLTRAQHPRVLAIGETGLDYYRLTGDLEWQRQRFRTHIRAARACGKPLVIHTRAACADTLRIMREENASQARGVMHCFTETWEVARAAIDMGFYISFSGIVSFKSAQDLRVVAQQVPLDRMLIETDSPYLAPAPFRGKVNQPAYVKHVAEALAQVKGVTVDEIAAASTRNFFELFRP
jgi:TatD DNase family protein